MAPPAQHARGRSLSSSSDSRSSSSSSSDSQDSRSPSPVYKPSTPTKAPEAPGPSAGKSTPTKAPEAPGPSAGKNKVFKTPELITPQLLKSCALSSEDEEVVNKGEKEKEKVEKTKRKTKRKKKSKKGKTEGKAGEQPPTKKRKISEPPKFTTKDVWKASAEDCEQDYAERIKNFGKHGTCTRCAKDLEEHKDQQIPRIRCIVHRQHWEKEGLRIKAAFEEEKQADKKTISELQKKVSDKETNQADKQVISELKKKILEKEAQYQNQASEASKAVRAKKELEEAWQAESKSNKKALNDLKAEVNNLKDISSKALTERQKTVSEETLKAQLKRQESCTKHFNGGKQ